MDLHVVSGFLGSGKTTAIVSALKTLLARSVRVGVITNDKGRYLVDTAFLGGTGVPTAEVPGDASAATMVISRSASNNCSARLTRTCCSPSRSARVWIWSGRSSGRWRR